MCVLKRFRINQNISPERRQHITPPWHPATHLMWTDNLSFFMNLFPHVLQVKRLTRLGLCLFLWTRRLCFVLNSEIKIKMFQHCALNCYIWIRDRTHCYCKLRTGTDARRCERECVRIEHFDRRNPFRSMDTNGNTVWICHRGFSCDLCNLWWASSLSSRRGIQYYTHFKHAFVEYCRLQISHIKSFRPVCVT